MERKSLEELKKRYGLSESDFWTLRRNNKNIEVMTHDGCKKIASQEKIEFFDINWINIGEQVGKYEYVYSLELYAKQAESDTRVHATGEANSENCKIAYPVAIAEKRAKDRAILLLVGFSELGVHSDVEGEISGAEKEFDNPEDGTEKQGKKLRFLHRGQLWDLAQSKNMDGDQLKAFMSKTLGIEVTDSGLLETAQLMQVFDALVALKAKEDDTSEVAL